MMNRFVAGLMSVFMLCTSAHATQVGTVAITQGVEGNYSHRTFGSLVSGTFEAKIADNGIVTRNTNGDLFFSFSIKINPKNVINNIDVSGSDLNDTVRGEVNSSNTAHFTLTLPRAKYEDKGIEQISTRVSFTNAAGNINFNPGFIVFTITPTVTLSANTNDVNFGPLIYDNGRITNQNANPQVILTYAVLNNARCKLESVNGFNLKHESGTNLIKYEVKGGAETAITAGENVNIKYIALEYNKVQKVLNFNVNTDSTNMPTAGNYKDTITCSIVSNG